MKEDPVSLRTRRNPYLSRGFMRGRYRDRTCDLFRVREALSR